MTRFECVSPQAQEDAEKLRSVVMPMEQEIAALKVKLTVAEDRVKELEASKVSQKCLERKTDFYNTDKISMLILLTKQSYPSKMSIAVWVISRRR